MHVLVGLGGNLGGLEQVASRIARAARALEERLPTVRVQRSGFYTSDPWGPIREQPRFVNAVVGLELARRVAPVAIMAELLGLEVELGRVRQEGAPQGPRTLDLDLLFVDREELHDPGPPPVRVPHPRIAERSFVLLPLADIMGATWPMPGTGRTIEACLDAAPLAQEQGTEAAPWLADAWHAP